MTVPCTIHAMHSGYRVFIATDGKTHEYTTEADYDLPRLAELLGASHVICPCKATDGSIDCEHRTAAEMIAAAGRWIWDTAGEIDVHPHAAETLVEMAEAQRCN